MFQIPKLSNDYLRLTMLQNAAFSGMLSILAYEMYLQEELIYLGGLALIITTLILDTLTYHNTVLVEVKSLKEMKESREEVNND